MLEIDRRLGIPGLAMFGRLDASGMYGRVTQSFKETFVEAPGYAQRRVTNGIGVPMLAIQVGLILTKI